MKTSSLSNPLAIFNNVLTPNWYVRLSSMFPIAIGSRCESVEI